MNSFKVPAHLSLSCFFSLQAFHPVNIYSVPEALRELFLTLSPLKPCEKAKYRALSPRPSSFFALSESSGGGGGVGGGGAVTLQTQSA